MNTDKILKILAQTAPSLPVAEAYTAAQALADAYIVALGEHRTALTTPGERLERAREDERLIKASHWAMMSLSPEDATNYTIRSIRAIRKQFPGLGLKYAKAIVDSLAEHRTPDPTPYPDDEYPEYEYEDEDYNYDPDVRIVDNGESFTYVSV